MTIERLMEEIALPAEGRQTVITYPVTDEKYRWWRRLFLEKEESFFDELEAYEGKEQLLLYLFVSLAAEAYDRFLTDGMPEAVIRDTFYDLTIWYHHCVREKKKCGLTEGRWLAKVIKGKVIRLGRLQFEPEGTILHVHIPEGESLTDTACDQSFQMADMYFDKSFVQYDCLSWLLDPALFKLLDHTSNIIKFQKRFKINEVVYSFRQAEQRIFGEILGDITQYPENTTLQKKAKSWLLAGGSLGMGYGTIDRPC